MRALLERLGREDVRLGALSNACGGYVKAVVRVNGLAALIPSNLQLGADEGEDRVVKELVLGRR